jgi:hypothetical protein
MISDCITKGASSLLITNKSKRVELYKRENGKWNGIKTKSKITTSLS